MTGSLSEDEGVDRLLSIGLDAVGSFDENVLGVEYQQEGSGAARYSPGEDVDGPVPNEHYLG